MCWQKVVLVAWTFNFLPVGDYLQYSPVFLADSANQNLEITYAQLLLSKFLVLSFIFRIKREVSIFKYMFLLTSSLYVIREWGRQKIVKMTKLEKKKKACWNQCFPTRILSLDLGVITAHNRTPASLQAILKWMSLSIN